MARTFVGGTPQRLESTTVPSVAYPFTMACWFKPGTYLGSTYFGIGNTATASYIAVAYSSGTFLAFFEILGGGVTSDANGPASMPLTAGKWHHIGCVATSATSRTMYVNGVAGTTDVTNVTPGTQNRVTINGLYPGGAVGSHVNGDIAYASFWTGKALTATEIRVLAAGVHPLNVQRETLTNLWPVIGDKNDATSVEVDIVGGNNLTLINAPHTGATDPPVQIVDFRTRKDVPRQAGPVLSLLARMRQYVYPGPDAVGGGATTIDMSGVLATATTPPLVPALRVIAVNNLLATARGVSIVPTKLTVNAQSTFARATGVGIVPTIREVIKPTFALANATARVPTMSARITAVRAVANATGIVPTKITVRAVGTPLAIANASALVPSIASGPVTLVAVPAIANASGLTPTKLIVQISAVRASATGTALTPVLHTTALTIPAIARSTGTAGTIAARLTAVRSSAAATAIAPTKSVVRITTPPAIARASAIIPSGLSPPLQGGTTDFADQIKRRKIHKERQYPTIP